MDWNIQLQTNIWRHFSTDKNTISNNNPQQNEPTVEMAGPNNSAIIYRQIPNNLFLFLINRLLSEHFEPDSESSLTANFKVNIIFIN